ncbi:stalk domain-containing protein [Paenibacillus lentus]|uniref:Copper amine oxidase-like N-terminal domain-containing protein n=1 Tax=Paenibacillus lentus TaxID=1338368 RepID=A0A3S8RXT0_9BACL|nr:stalk domain-containing protein [Paenibacillus lentus]AZK47617.1 hypothetical protein EIM92_16885 [Paenibacillus lentus]
MHFIHDYSQSSDPPHPGDGVFFIDKNFTQNAAPNATFFQISRPINHIIFLNTNQKEINMNRFTMINRASIKIAVIGLAAIITMTSLLYTDSSSTAAAAKQQSNIKLLFNDQEYSFSSTPIIYKNSLYLPLRDLGELLGSVVVWNAENKTVTMTYPNQVVVTKLNALDATVNGKAVQLDSPAIVRDGRTFVPIRFFSEAIGASVDWQPANRTVSLSKTPTFAKGIGVNMSIWLNKATGDVFFAYPYDAEPVKLGQLEANIQGFLNISAYNLPGEQQSFILKIEDVYGEPSIHTTVYTAFVKNNQILKQSKANYFKRYEQNTLIDHEGNPILTDGKLLTIINTEGQIIKEYDLPKLSGKDEIHSVQAVSSSYLLIRPNLSGHLTLINLKDNSMTLLYQQFLSSEEQEFAEMNDVPYFGDDLAFLGETEDGELKFENRSPFYSEGKKYVHKLNEVK